MIGFPGAYCLTISPRAVTRGWSWEEAIFVIQSACAQANPATTLPTSTVLGLSLLSAANTSVASAVLIKATCSGCDIHTTNETYARHDPAAADTMRGWPVTERDLSRSRRS